MTHWKDDVVRAMEAYALDPGHSDLDDEQPMTLKVGDDYVAGVTLGDVRRAQAVARTRTNLAEAVRRVTLYVGPGNAVTHGDHVVRLARCYEPLEMSYAEAFRRFVFDLSCLLRAAKP